MVGGGRGREGFKRHVRVGGTPARGFPGRLPLQAREHHNTGPPPPFSQDRNPVRANHPPISNPQPNLFRMREVPRGPLKRAVPARGVAFSSDSGRGWAWEWLERNLLPLLILPDAAESKGISLRDPQIS